MKYTPNFSDPRVIIRCKRAIGFACGVMSTTKSHAWSSRYIDKYVGKSNNPLSRYLRDQLLICTDEFYRYNSTENKCKEYQLNENGLRALCENLKLDTHSNYPSVLQVATADHSSELDSGNFTYKDKSNRLWHPLQRYRRRYRNQILASSGYEYDYDIATCAPTLIHQFAQKCGMDEYCFAITHYLANKQQVREQLASALDLETAAAKEIITALFAGAVISRHEESDISYILAGDLARIEYLKQDEFIQQLVADIKRCWSAITEAHVITRRRNAATNKLIRVSCRDKWHVYFELERQVINCVRTYLDQISARYFLLHDGWTCDQVLDIANLENYIHAQTGYHVKLEHEKLTQQ